MAGLKNFNSPRAQIPKNEAISTPNAKDIKNSFPFVWCPKLLISSQWASKELKIAAIGWTTAPSWIQSNSRQCIWYALISVEASLEYLSHVPSTVQFLPLDHVCAIFLSSFNFEPVLPAIPTPIVSNKKTFNCLIVFSLKSSYFDEKICLEKISATSSAIIDSIN